MTRLMCLLLLLVACSDDSSPTAPGPGTDPPDLPDPPMGDTLTWVGGSGDWSDPDQWDLGRVPTAGDAVIIDAAGTYTVSLTGLVDVASLVLGGDSGSQTLDGGEHTLTVGGGTIGERATLRLNSNPAKRDAVAWALNGDVQLDGTLEWKSGAIEGEGALDVGANGVVRADASSAFLRLSVDVNNAGAFILLQETEVRLQQGSVSTGTTGRVEFAGDGTLSGVSEGWLWCEGELRKSSGDESSRYGTGSHQMTIAGSVVVESGELRVLSDALWTAQAVVNPGARLRMEASSLRAGFTVDGAVTMRGEHHVGAEALDTFVFADLTLEGGTRIYGPGALSLTGSATWNGGWLDGLASVEVSSGATLLVQGPSTRKIIDTVVINHGTTTFAGNAGVEFGEEGRAVNEVGASWTMEESGRFEIATGANGAGFTNRGTFEVEAGTTRTEIDYRNEGELRLFTGGMKALGSFEHAEGALLVGGGTNGGFNSNGRLDLVQATSNQFAGVIEVQAADGPGKLDILGNANFASTSIVRLQIPGPSDPLVYAERLGVTNTASLAGRLEVELLFTPESGDLFQVMSWAARNGQFDTIAAGGLLAEMGEIGLVLESP